MPEKAHCPRCAGYEDKVMRRKEGEEMPASVTPCPKFEMSERFRDWAVERMRGEVGGHISAAGLDRMAPLKSKDVAGKQEHAEDAKSGPGDALDPDEA